MSGHINLLIVSLEFNFNNIMEAVKSAEGREYTIADDRNWRRDSRSLELLRIFYKLGMDRY